MLWIENNSLIRGLVRTSGDTSASEWATHGFAYAKHKKSILNPDILEYVCDIIIIRNDFQS